MVKENNHTDGDVDPLNHRAQAMVANFQFKFCLQQINNNVRTPGNAKCNNPLSLNEGHNDENIETFP